MSVQLDAFTATLDSPLERTDRGSAAALVVDHRPFTVMTYNVRQVNADDTGIYGLRPSMH